MFRLRFLHEPERTTKAGPWLSGSDWEAYKLQSQSNCLNRIISIVYMWIILEINNTFQGVVVGGVVLSYATHISVVVSVSLDCGGWCGYDVFRLFCSAQGYIEKVSELGIIIYREGVSIVYFWHSKYFNHSLTSRKKNAVEGSTRVWIKSPHCFPFTPHLAQPTRYIRRPNRIRLTWHGMTVAWISWIMWICVGDAKTHLHPKSGPQISRLEVDISMQQWIWLENWWLI